MGFGIGSKKSSSKTSVTTTTQNSGFSEIAGNAVAVQGSGNNISMLDGGAIEKAFSFAESVSSSANNATKGIVEQSIAAVADSRKTESENVSGKAVTYFAYVAIAAAVAWAVRGLK